MYSVRLLLRPLVKEVPSLDRRLAHFWKTRPSEQKQRRYGRRDRDQLAGIRRQTEVMGYTPDELSEFDELDDEDLDASMVEQVYDAHQSEMKWKESRQALAEYRQKHYKVEQEPALLSWEDIEQIRRLHWEEKWPVSALARSFPANEAVIHKVCKSNRNPGLEEKFKHDRKVADNWILLRKGKLKISDELRLHCLKFTNRVARPMTSRDLAAINYKPPRPPGSFLNLIKPPGEEEKIEVQNKEEIDPDVSPISESEDILKHLRKHITLEEARKKELERIADSGVNVEEDSKLFVYGPGPSKDGSSQGSGKEEYFNPSMYAEKSIGTKPKTNDFVSKWDSTGRSVKAVREAMMAPFVSVPERIVIPETAKKPGAIYRVEDCFYDENGELMYRVPGLKL